MTPEFVIFSGEFVIHKSINVRDSIYSISIVSAFSCGRAKRTANTLRVDSYFFGNGGKNVRFQKNPDTCGRGLIGQ